MGQTISIAPEIWARVRHLAFDTQSTASKLTEMALIEYLDRIDKPPARLAVAQDPPKRYFNEPQEEITPRSIDRAAFGLPPRESLVPDAVVPVIEQELRQVVHKYDPAAMMSDPLLRESVSGQDALPPPAKRTPDYGAVEEVLGGKAVGGPIIINDPKEVAKRVGAAMDAAVATSQPRPFTPVPKPVRKPRPKR
jgi:hypothetical protein